jgi:hypothetical protein
MTFCMKTVLCSDVGRVGKVWSGSVGVFLPASCRAGGGVDENVNPPEVLFVVCFDFSEVVPN